MFDLQMFTYDNNVYGNPNANAVDIMAGKDILVCMWSLDGSKLLAVKGQQDLTLNRSANTITVSSKDTESDWERSLSGIKNWSADFSGLYVFGDESQAILEQAFTNSLPLLIKIINKNLKKGLYGGVCKITEFSIEAPNDDAVTYSCTLTGDGELVNLASVELEQDTMPESSQTLASLTVVSVPGAETGDTSIYVNPTLTPGNKYFYTSGKAPLAFPYYGQVMEQTEWNGTSDITGLTQGDSILIVETDSEGKALKAGSAVVSVDE